MSIEDAELEQLERLAAECLAGCRCSVHRAEFNVVANPERIGRLVAEVCRLRRVAEAARAAVEAGTYDEQTHAEYELDMALAGLDD